MYTGQLHPKSFSMFSASEVLPGSSGCLHQGRPQLLLLTGLFLLSHQSLGLFLPCRKSPQILLFLLWTSSAGIVFSASNSMSSQKSRFPCTMLGHSSRCCGILRFAPTILEPVGPRLTSASFVPFHTSKFLTDSVRLGYIFPYLAVWQKPLFVLSLTSGLSDTLRGAGTAWIWRLVISYRSRGRSPRIEVETEKRKGGL